ncbi:hypothetical protein KIN20_007675 [Parelaphostrongylus tenuis]|uniref:Nanos-type domain-containing protein n=1 Tax=Parelaphostrongylus tenuis TaxID=148309 RepID=A0AAD5QJC3_PARTN|nr:hypothetical protein KIN20_007675 [Parelaphostrongylus tenuis]
MWRLHNVKKRGIVECLHLFAYTCTYYGVTKESAHTEGYCPRKHGRHNNKYTIDDFRKLLACRKSKSIADSATAKASMVNL